MSEARIYQNNECVKAFVEIAEGLPVHKRLAAYLFENTDSFSEVTTFMTIEYISKQLSSTYLDIEREMGTRHSAKEYFDAVLKHISDTSSNPDLYCHILPQENLNNMELRRIVFDRKRDTILALIAVSVFDDTKLEIKGQCESEYARWYNNLIPDSFTSNTRTVHETTAIGQDGSFVGKAHIVELAKLDRAKEEFYPYFPKSYKAIVDEFFASESNVLIFFGIPGSGKSTLSRYIVHTFPKNETVNIINNATVFESPLFATAMAQDTKTKLYIFEDSDILLSSRRSGNKFMSALLNTTDGIIPNKTKYVFTTNLEHLGDLDPAILRAGRLFGAFQFRKLTPE